jgi:D-3-phosphoglycerate dehydrogenase
LEGPNLRVLHVEGARYDEDARRTIEQVATVDYRSCPDHRSLISALKECRYGALFVRLGLNIDRSVFEAAPDLRFVVTPTTGLDHIDLAAAKERGVKVISLRPEKEFLENVHATAEHTWALLLAMIRKLPAAQQDVVGGRWRREPFVGIELHQKRLGIVGAGRLGRKVAGYGLAFGMSVRAHDIDASAIALAPHGTVGVELDELLATSDVLSIHLPLSENTRGFVSADRIRKLPRGAFLVNTARGELIDERALLAALESGHLAGAALDVLSGDSAWEEAGAPAAHPLMAYAKAHDNLVLTPHIGGYALDSIQKTRRLVAERFAALAVSASGAQQR